MRRMKEKTTDLLTAREAAVVLSKNAGYDISPAYVRVLANARRLTPVKIDGRTNLYQRGEVDQITVSHKRGRRKEEQP